MCLCSLEDTVEGPGWVRGRQRGGWLAVGGWRLSVGGGDGGGGRSEEDLSRVLVISAGSVKPIKAGESDGRVCFFPE